MHKKPNDKFNKYNCFDKILRTASMLVSFSILLILALVIGFIINESLPFVNSIFLQTFTSSSWRPLASPPIFGLRAMILGTLYVGILASLIALPLSIGCASFISCYLKGKLKHAVLALMDLLAGIPSVVYGLLGFYTIVTLLESTGLLAAGESILAASLTLSIMIIPYMISAYTKAFSKIYLRYGIQSQALGVSRWYSMTHLIFFQAKGNILTGYAISLSKALGETMAVMMVVGNSPILPKLFGRGLTLSGLIALEVGSAQRNSLHYHSLYSAALILLILLLIVNSIVRKIEKWLENN